MKKIIPIVLAILMNSWWIQAQNEEEGRYTATLAAGVVFSQIDGDEDGGFNKVSFNGGVRGGVRFGNAWELCTEILFSQKGSYVIDFDKTYHLDYVEVPVLFYYKDWKARDANNREYRRVMVGVGPYYARLINPRIRQYGVVLEPGDAGYVNVMPNEIGFALDANVFITRQIGINLRWSRSLTSIVDQPIRQGRGYVNNRTIVVRVLFRL